MRHCGVIEDSSDVSFVRPAIIEGSRHRIVLGSKMPELGDRLHRAPESNRKH